MNRFYVYVIFRLNGIPCYVGKGKGGRWMQHIRRSCNIHLTRIYRQSGNDLPIVKVREHLTNLEACATEVALIGAIGRADLGRGPLVNLSDGGDGTGRRHADTTLQKLRSIAKGRSKAQSERNKGNKYGIGNKRSPEGQARVAASVIKTNSTRQVTPEYREKRREIAAALAESRGAEWRKWRAQRMREGLRRKPPGQTEFPL